jgi:hypothetical protein
MRIWSNQIDPKCQLDMVHEIHFTKCLGKKKHTPPGAKDRRDSKHHTPRRIRGGIGSVEKRPSSSVRVYRPYGKTQYSANKCDG